MKWGCEPCGKCEGANPRIFLCKYKSIYTTIYGVNFSKNFLKTTKNSFVTIKKYKLKASGGAG